MRRNRSDRPTPNEPRQAAPRARPREAFALVLTGKVCDNHFRVAVDGKPVALAHDAFTTLVDLVHGVATVESGLTPVDRLAVHRLRRSLDRQVGPGVGRQLIETGGGGLYRLAIPKSQIRKRVFLTPCFFELNERHVISAEQMKKLRKSCGRRKSLETELKPK